MVNIMCGIIRFIITATILATVGYVVVANSVEISPLSIGSGISLFASTNIVLPMSSCYRLVVDEDKDYILSITNVATTHKKIDFIRHEIRDSLSPLQLLYADDKCVLDSVKDILKLVDALSTNTVL